METLELRDGRRVVLRPVRADDAPLLARGFAALSPDARYARFLTTKSSLSDDELRHLTNVDQVSHVAWGAVDAERPEDGVAIGRAVRLEDEPEVAEIALAILDAWQGQGLGARLLDVLVERVAGAGVTRIRAHVRYDNDAMRALLERRGGVVVERDAGAMTIELTLPATRSR